MDDVSGLEAIAAGDFGGAGLAAAQRPALGQKLGARCAMNGAATPPPPRSVRVGGVDDGIDVERGDVGDEDSSSRDAPTSVASTGGGMLMPGIVACRAMRIISSVFDRRRGGGYFGSPILSCLAVGAEAVPTAPWSSPASPLPVDVKAFLISNLHGFPGAAGTDCPEAEAYRRGTSAHSRTSTMPQAPPLQSGTWTASFAVDRGITPYQNAVSNIRRMHYIGWACGPSIARIALNHQPGRKP